MFKFDREDAELVIKSFGQVGLYFSLALIVPILFVLIYGEGIHGVEMFLYPALFSFALSFVIKKFIKIKKEPKDIHAMVSIALIWVILPWIGAMPFIFNGFGITDSYFESVSSLTTTGLSLIDNPDSLPKSLIFWRSLEGWIGGAGIVVLALMGFFHYVSAARLMEAEGREDRHRPSIIGTVKRIWWIYGIMTFIGIILLLASQIPLFEAINYSMSAISTTGTNISNEGLLGMNNVGAEISLMIIMIMGALSFAVHHRFMKGEMKAYYKDVETKALFAILIISVLIMLPFFSEIPQYGGEALRHASFYATSAITAGGFESLPRGVFNDYIKLVLTILMLSGGAAGSTAGGIKLIRGYIFAKSIYWKIKSLSLPSNAYFAKKIKGEEVKGTDINTINTFIILYIIAITLGVAVILVTMPEVSAMDALYEVTSAQGNAGIGEGIVSMSMPTIAKFSLCINMIIGRIEIIPLMAALGFILNMQFRRNS